MGFAISHKENEKRRAIVPEDIPQLTCPDGVYIETGYGDILGLTDQDYLDQGCKVVSREEILKQDIICDPKIGDADFLGDLHPGQSIFGWVHATQNREVTDQIINSGITAYAWEKMYEKGRHVFWRNNELAGEGAIMQSFLCYGRMPYETNVAVLGRGNTARGAIKILNKLGANVVQYDRRMEELFREELGKYDVVVNCVLWDVLRDDHIIYRADLQRMKKGAMIVDVSCDRNGAVETSIPTTIESPTYVVDGILHYCVDHTPSLFYKTFTWYNSELLVPYINQLMTEEIGDVLLGSVVIRDGSIIDPEISEKQNRT